MTDKNENGDRPRRTRGARRSRILRKIGIDPTPKGRWLVQFRRRFFVIVLAILAAPLVGMIVMSFYSTSPSFCKSCHIMQPYYDAWASSGHKDVACVECHYPPGKPQAIAWKKFQAVSQVVKYVTRTYSSKPYAEVEDASCLRSGCHSTRLLRGKVISESGVVFDHKPHLEGVRYGRQLRCVSCHSQIVVGKHIQVTYDTCYLCHLKGRKQGRNIEVMGGCLGCHTLPDRVVQSGNIEFNHREFLTDRDVRCESCHQNVIQGKGEVSQDRCITCHNEMEKIERFNDVEFIHDNHVTKHNTACFHCHREIRHGVVAAGTKDLQYDCASCHTQNHDLERDFYRGIGAKSVEPMPSPMYLANVDCIGCHAKPKSNGTPFGHSETYTGTEERCVACHSPKYEGTLTEGQGLVTQARDMLQGSLAAVRQAAEGADESAGTVTQVLAEAEFNLGFVESINSAHNIYYAAEILKTADRALSSAAEALGCEIEDASALPIISGGFCATLCHAKLGVKVPAEEVDYKGKTMPHSAHIEDMELACAACHDIGAHKDVRLKGIEACTDCHEEDELK